MTEIQRPVLRYFGGKFMLAPWIISHFPAHRVYVEPFGGAASVLMQKPRSYAEVYNDLDGEVVNLFRVLQNKKDAAELERLLRLTPFAREEFKWSYALLESPVQLARAIIIRSFMGFGANGHNSDTVTGFRSSSNRSGTTPAHDWANYSECLAAFCERLKGVVIENRDAKEVMAQQDSSETLHYVDPPYVHATRGTTKAYRHEMTDAEHAELLRFLTGLKGAVILSGYRSSVYEELGWHRIDRTAMADGANERVESLWLNPAAEAAQPQRSLFGSNA